MTRSTIICITLACALCLGIYLVWKLNDDTKKEPDFESLKGTLVYALRDIKEGSLVTADSVEERIVKQYEIPGSAVCKASDVIGRRPVYGIEKGLILSNYYFLRPEQIDQYKRTFQLPDLPTSIDYQNPTLGKKEQKAISGPEHQSLKLYKGFFPYQSCLLVTINQVLKKPDKILQVKATIEDVYRGNDKKGSPLSVAINDNDIAPTSFAFLSALKNTKQIVAFNFTPKSYALIDEPRKMSGTSICNLWLPYASSGFQSKDIAQLKSIIKESPTEPTQAKAAFQRFLETKWTTDRINEFCSPETQRNWLLAFDHPANRNTDWFGTLHAGKAKALSGKKINWSASVSNDVPILYSINVDSPDTNISGWDLGLTDPCLEEWTAENFLLFRLCKSINQAAFADWSLNHESHPSATDYWGLFTTRSNETLVKDKNGKVTRYQCDLENGKRLFAILTTNQRKTIDKILINGKLDPGWNDMYKKAMINLEKCKNKVLQK